MEQHVTVDEVVSNDVLLRRRGVGPCHTYEIDAANECWVPITAGEGLLSGVERESGDALVGEIARGKRLDQPI